MAFGRRFSVLSEGVGNENARKGWKVGAEGTNSEVNKPYRHHPTISKDDLESEADEQAYALPSKTSSTRRHDELGERDNDYSTNRQLDNNGEATMGKFQESGERARRNAKFDVSDGGEKLKRKPLNDDMLLPTFAPRNAHRPTRYLVTVRDEEAQSKEGEEVPMRMANLKISKHSDGPDSKTGLVAHAAFSDSVRPTTAGTMLGCNGGGAARSRKLPSSGVRNMPKMEGLAETAFAPPSPLTPLDSREELGGQSGLGLVASSSAPPESESSWKQSAFSAYSTIPSHVIRSRKLPMTGANPASSQKREPYDATGQSRVGVGVVPGKETCIGSDVGYGSDSSGQPARPLTSTKLPSPGHERDELSRPRAGDHRQTRQFNNFGSGGKDAATVHLRPEDNPLYRTGLCKSWIAEGVCWYGPRCSFAHGEHELRPRPTMMELERTSTCRRYQSTGDCPFGNTCRFRHDPPAMTNGNEVERLRPSIAGSRSVFVLAEGDPRPAMIFRSMLAKPDTHYGRANNVKELACIQLRIDNPNSVRLMMEGSVDGELDECTDEALEFTRDEHVIYYIVKM